MHKVGLYKSIYIYISILKDFFIIQTKLAKKYLNFDEAFFS